MSTSSSQCACAVAGGPPGGLHELLQTTGSVAARAALARAALHGEAARATASRSHGAFDWRAASAGAGVTAVVALLVAGGGVLFSRRRDRQTGGASLQHSAGR